MGTVPIYPFSRVVRARSFVLQSRLPFASLESNKMARHARLVVPGLPHHITHRGNRRDAIFLGIEDRKAYLRILRKFSGTASVQINSYVLMPNHVHIIAIPEYKDSLAEMIGSAHGTYAEMFNAVHGTVGHLWEGRFASFVMDDSHFWNALRYVERNPVRARLVKRAEDYPWSSARAHCGLRRDPLLSPIPTRNTIENWSDWLAGLERAAVLQELREHTATGHPFGSKEFIQNLERQLGHPVVLRPRGRPPKEKG
jgi:putative transposase